MQKEDFLKNIFFSCSKFPPSPCKVSPLHGGWSNENYLVELPERSFCLRLSSAKKDEIKNLKHEKHNENLICKFFPTPKFIFFDTKKGIKISPFLQGARNLNKNDIKNAKIIEQLCGIFRQLHQSKAKFKGEFDLEKNYNKVLHSMEDKKAFFALKYARQNSQNFHAICEKIQLCSWQKSPCHNDLNLANLLLYKNKIFLIDFEYSASNDPLCDLAYFCLSCEFDLQKSFEILGNYLQKKPKKEEKMLFLLFSCGLNFFWSAWSVARYQKCFKKDFLRFAKKSQITAKEQMKIVKKYF